jgi:hypothetical protein
MGAGVVAMVNFALLTSDPVIEPVSVATTRTSASVVGVLFTTQFHEPVFATPEVKRVQVPPLFVL